ncbi:hypothetical protein LDENG_00192440 [Lucifuga dentata]|nr:hypothetical protein LDENG_00192440 [Lucifuga dentata]
MGTILQERVAQPCFDRIPIREREWKKKAPWNNNRPDASSNKMGRRQSQRKSLQPQHTLPCQENTTEKKLQQRRKHKPSAASANSSVPPHSARGSSKARPLTPAADRKEVKVQQAAGVYRKEEHARLRGSTPAPAFPCLRLSDSSPDRPESRSLNLSSYGDSDTDLSESERFLVPPLDCAPPQLDLRPEVIHPEDSPSCSHRPTSQRHCSFHFPDFLPPPFNSWSLSQLAVFYNLDGTAAPRPRPVGPLERYLERLLQLEWHQIQTMQEESGKSAVSDVTSSCHRLSSSTSARLSNPKSILQCQRAFPLTFLSSLAGHSALLSGCACTLCRIRYSTCSVTSCRSTHGHIYHSRLSPLPECRGLLSLPRRSYSETRVHSSERSLASRAQGSSSPVRGSSHLRRMQALGNIRNPAHGVATKNHSTATDSSVRAGVGAQADVLDCQSGGVRKRSASEHGRRGAERRGHGSEKLRSGSECRRAEWRRKAELQEIKPDAVAAIMDNLPASKHSPISRTNRPKQVEFVT